MVTLEGDKNPISLYKLKQNEIYDIVNTSFYTHFLYENTSIASQKDVRVFLHKMEIGTSE